jgi:uncharacterized protein (DUF362 family)
MADRNGTTRKCVAGASEAATAATAAAGGASTHAPRRGHTRRRVLLWAAGSVAGASALGVGTVFLTDRLKRFARHAERRIGDHRVDLPRAVPRMVIARGADPGTNVRAAIERLGGMAALVTAGDVVLIKPSLGWERTPEQAANTQPEVIAEVVRLCRTADARRVIVCDCPLARSRRAFEISGILAAAQAAGAEVLVPEESRYVTVRISERLGTWDVLEPFAIATKIINVPTVKHHGLTGVSCGLKNWFGITAKNRMMLHADLQRSIAELAAMMRPTLTIVDASRVLMEHGPAGGSFSDVKPVRTVAAGFDPVALDAWACTVLGQPFPGNIAIAESMGLGRADFASLAPTELTTG